MPVRTRSPRVVARLTALGLAALVVVVGVGCSDSSGDDVTGSSTSSVETTALPPPTGVTSSSEPATPPSEGEGLPSSPSTLPPDLSGTCAPLGETYGIDAVQPRDTSSWVDERQRVVVDARREAQLLSVARNSAPAVVAGDLTTLLDHASFVADAVEGASSYAAAVSAIDAGSSPAAVDGAAAAVAAWRTANC
jgi:hypothetical protein